MEKLKLIETKERQLPDDRDMVWRYLDLHMFLYLIYQKRFKFTRMDQFEDPLEGIPYETLQKFITMAKYDISLGQILLEEDHFNLKDEKIVGRIDKIHLIQSKTFVSCWFSEKRESMAMWNLYSNPDGVAIKIPFGKLKTLLTPETDEQNLVEFYCGKVSYQDFTNKDPYPENSISRLKRIALRKDISFSHEKELRFVIKTKSLKEGTIRLNSKEINLKELNLSVVCHPRMAAWKRKNIRQILKTAELNDNLSVSEIKLRY